MDYWHADPIAITLEQANNAFLEMWSVKWDTLPVEEYAIYRSGVSHVESARRRYKSKAVMGQPNVFQFSMYLLVV